MLNIYKYYDDYQSLDGIEEYKQKIISSGNMSKMLAFAKDIIKGRWEEAEPVIMKDVWYAYLYAKDIIKGRWEEAEEYIKQDPMRWDRYKYEFGIE